MQLKGLARVLVAGALLLSLSSPARALGPCDSDEDALMARAVSAYGRLPLRFEANEGQTDSRVRYLSRGSGAALFLTPTEAVLALEQGARGGSRTAARQAAVLRMRLLGGHPDPAVTGQDALPGRSHYFLGKDPAQWRTDVRHFGKVHYREIYPGIDLLFYGNHRQLEYDFIVAPGADPQAIRLAFEGVEKSEISPQGDLIFKTEGGEVRFNKPFIYQEIDGVRKEIAGNYVFHSPLAIRRSPLPAVGFHVASYDKTKPLIIDPVLSYSTYLGGQGDDLGLDIAVDGAGNVYLTGETDSLSFPTQSPYQGALAGVDDAFVAKLDATGALVYSTYLGGSGHDRGRGIAIDGAGNVYLTGTTESDDFPTQNPFQAARAMGEDSFVAKLDATGAALVFSTYLGGNGVDRARGIAVDGAGNVYVTGRTASTNFPMQNPVQGAHAGDFDAFVSKLSPAGSALLFSTYLGGSVGDRARGVAVDGSGLIYVTGVTCSTDFPTENPFQGTHAGSADVFVAKLDSLTPALLFSTYLGGSGNDRGRHIVLDGTGGIYVGGSSDSTDFPLQNPFQGANAGGSDAFVSKFDASGTVLLYSTYLGGSGHDRMRGMAVDGAGNVYATGYANSTDFPLVNPLRASNAGRTDVFVSKLDASGSVLIFSTYLGGGDHDRGYGIGVDDAGNAYVVGYSDSTNFPTRNPYQGSNAGGTDAFIAKITEIGGGDAGVTVTKTDSPDPVVVGSTLTYAVTVTNHGATGVTGVTLTDTLPPGVAFVSATAPCAEAGGVVTCDLGSLAGGASAVITIVVTPSAPGVLANTVTVSTNETAPATATAATTVVTGGASCLGTGAYRINGKVSLGSGGGMQGATMRLDGPGGCTATTTTSPLGRYGFPTLGEGTYTVTPSKEGCTFTPPNRSVEVSETNVRAFFTGSCP